MNLPRGMGGKELLDALGFVSREVVDDDVNFPSLGLSSDRMRGTPRTARWCARRSNAKHFAASNVQRSVERESSMAVVLEAMSLARPGDRGRTRCQDDPEPESQFSRQR